MYRLGRSDAHNPAGWVGRQEQGPDLWAGIPSPCIAPEMFSHPGTQQILWAAAISATVPDIRATSVNKINSHVQWSSQLIWHGDAAMNNQVIEWV